MAKNRISWRRASENYHQRCNVQVESVVFDEDSVRAKLLDLEHPCYFVLDGQNIGASSMGDKDGPEDSLLGSIAAAPALGINQLGDEGFRNTHNTEYSYYAGAMANGIASAQMVIELGKEGFLGSFGAAGLVAAEVEAAIQSIKQALPRGPYAFNLIHSPFEPALEHDCVDLYLKHRVNCIEAAAYIELTPYVVYYRAAGLELDQQNQIKINNRIIAKISRREVAAKFMEPAPVKILQQLIDQRLITTQQAEMAQKVPMADDITVEADSAGHTDNRPLVVLLPSILSLRNEIQEKYSYEQPVRVGAGGGIGAPNAALAVFVMGAAYVVTGSVNQSCVEAGASEHSRKLLAEADMADVAMAPAADMFEMGAKLQVLKRGTLFPMRAQKLHDIYLNYESIEHIPVKEREKLEKQIFKKGLDEVWEDTVAFFSGRDPGQIERATDNPKRKMALIFRWYLGLSSRWSNAGEQGRELDYQIWCGPAMGAFNAWVKNSYLADINNRRVVDVARHIMNGAAYLYRIQNLEMQGMKFPLEFADYRPQPFTP